MSNWVIVPAAGRGSRFGGEVPKQFLEVGGRSLLAHTLDALAGHPGDERAAGEEESGSALSDIGVFVEEPVQCQLVVIAGW